MSDSGSAPKPRNVIEALARVTAEMGGIEKLSPQERAKRGLGGGDERGVSYAYRGIDQIAAAAAPLFGKYGVVVVPNVRHREVKDLTINGKPWTDTALDVEWTVYGPGGLEDRIVSTTPGLGRDNSDKGPNKALTQSYKNLLLRVLCIGDPADDVDGHTHEADAGIQPPQEPPTNPKAAPLIERLAALPEEARQKIEGWWPSENWVAASDEGLERASGVLAKAEAQAAAEIDQLDRMESTPSHVGEGGEGTRTCPEDPPASSGPLVRPASNPPSAAARAALHGDKPALGAVKKGEPSGSTIEGDDAA